MISRLPCYIIIALSWNTKENQVQILLSKAINKNRMGERHMFICKNKIVGKNLGIMLNDGLSVKAIC